MNEENNNQEDDINVDDLFRPKEETVITLEENKETESKEEKAPVIDAQAITRAVQEGVQQGIKAVTGVTTRSSEVDNFLRTDEGKLYEKYGDQIRKVASSPEYIHLPIDNVVGLVLGTKMASIGAKIEENARTEQKGNQSGSGAGGVRNINPDEKVSAWGMSKDDFEQTVADAKSGKFTPK